MKSYLPIILFILCFSGFLSFQVGMDYFNLNATLPSDEDGKGLHLESTFKTAVEKSVFTEEKPIVLINFWAAWCSPCLQELDSLNQLEQNFPGVQIVSIHTDKTVSSQEIQNLITNYQIKYEVIEDDGTISDKFLAERLPYSLLFYKGKLKKVISGTFDYSSSSFFKFIRSLK